MLGNNELLGFYDDRIGLLSKSIEQLNVNNYHEKF